MRKLSHLEIVARQSRKKQEPSIPLTVILNDIRSLYNVGSVFRTADGVGAEKIWLCGITGCPPHPRLCKTALGSEERVPWVYHADAAAVAARLKADGYHIVLLEQTDQALEFSRFRPAGPVAMVLGNEIGGVDDGLLALADITLEIPMAGIKNSLNVAVAFGIVAYHIRGCLVQE